MRIWDKDTGYGTPSRILHWGTALLITWQFVGMASKLALGREHSLSRLLGGNHGQVGTVLFGLIVLRLLWAFANRHNRPPHGAGLLGRLAVAGQTALYLLMLAVPLLALLRAWGGERGFAPFGFEIFAPRSPEMVVTAAVGLGDRLHGELAWLMGALILGHIAMALVHHFLLRDGTMKRMAA